MSLDFLRRILPARFEDGLYLEAAAEVFRLNQQTKRLKDAMELEIREHIAERRLWLRRENQLLEDNTRLAVQLAAAHARLILLGEKEISG